MAMGVAEAGKLKRGAGRPKKKKNQTTMAIDGCMLQRSTCTRFRAFVVGMRLVAKSVGADLGRLSAQWQQRGMHIARTEAEEAGVCRLPTAKEGVQQWVERSVSAPGAGVAWKKAKPIVMSAATFAELRGGRAAAKRAILQQLVEFVDFARRCARRGALVEVREREGAGLGLWAAADLAKDTVLAGADFEGAVDWKESGLLLESRGRVAGVLGPAALANSGCGECANARLEDAAREGGRWRTRLVAGNGDWECAIPKGAEVLIRQDPPEGETWWCGCGKQITKRGAGE